MNKIAKAHFICPITVWLDKIQLYLRRSLELWFSTSRETYIVVVIYPNNTLLDDHCRQKVSTCSLPVNWYLDNKTGANEESLKIALLNWQFYVKFCAPKELSNYVVRSDPDTIPRDQCFSVAFSLKTKVFVLPTFVSIKNCHPEVLHSRDWPEHSIHAKLAQCWTHYYTHLGYTKLAVDWFSLHTNLMKYTETAFIPFQLFIIEKVLDYLSGSFQTFDS